MSLLKPKLYLKLREGINKSQQPNLKRLKLDKLQTNPAELPHAGQSRTRAL